MKFNNIKKILRKQVQNKVKTFWVYNEENKEFINIYKMYSDKLKIYTPQQLIDYLDEFERFKEYHETEKAQ
jgi:hypothetical protein